MSVPAYLEDMEGFKLDGARRVLQENHHELEIVRISHILHHDPRVGPI